MGKNRTVRGRPIAAFLALMGMLLMSSGFAVMATAGSAGAAEVDDCEPQEASTETTDWVAASPGEGWYQVDERVKTPATEDQIVDVVWYVWTGGPRQENNPPGVNEAGWNPTGADPQGQPHQNRPVGTPYFVAHGQSDGGDWFLRKGTLVPGQDAVYEYKFAFDHPAVPCDDVEGPEVCPDGTDRAGEPIGTEPCDEEVAGPPPGEDPPAAAPPVNDPPAKGTNPAADPPAASTPTSQVAGPTIPTTVKAGLGEDVAELAAARTSQGVALVGVGALVMLAGGLGMVRRRGVLARS